MSYYYQYYIEPLIIMPFCLENVYLVKSHEKRDSPNRFENYQCDLSVIVIRLTVTSSSYVVLIRCDVIDLPSSFVFEMNKERCISRKIETIMVRSVVR